MKKAYMTPEMEVMNIETVEMMAASSLTMYGSDEDAVDAANQLGNDRRGTWGNLWN